MAQALQRHGRHSSLVARRDPAGLFNAGLDGNLRRAIDIREGDTVDASAFKALVRAAVKLNAAG